MNKVEIDGDYLVIAPNLKTNLGNHQMLTERNFLYENIKNFLRNYPDITLQNIVVYELRKFDFDLEKV